MRSIRSCIVLLGLAVTTAWARGLPKGPLPAVQAEEIIGRTRELFWSHAVGEDGKPLTPTDDQERTALLIPQDQARRVVDDAFDYGLALWCGVEWNPTYLQYMQVERRKSRNVKQVAFIGMLFGVTQGTIKRISDGACTPEDKSEVVRRIQKEKRRLTKLLKD